MSRLIDADKLLQELRALDWQELYLPAHFEGLIEEQPTAYDPEQVMEQLKEKRAAVISDFERKGVCENVHEFDRGRAVGIIKAIEIARKGGLKNE